MTEQLPITITIESELIKSLDKITSAANKLEALFNFHALTAGWYGDEEDILTIGLVVETETSLSEQKETLASSAIDEQKITHFSDDVTCCIDNSKQQLRCHIAITGSELTLLTSQPKVLAGFLEKKLRKVLNLIAGQQSLTAI